MKRRRDYRTANQRSPEARAWQWMYKTAEWAGIRRRQLMAHPLCERHLKLGQIVAADTVHHREAHKGDWQKFIDGPFESVCGPCHAGPIQSQEARELDYSLEIDAATGFPVDPRHPANR